MNSIILATGKGSRIPQISLKKPKCLININGTAILSRQIAYHKKSKIKKIIIVRGYKKNHIKFKSVIYVENKNYRNNEQLASLLTAKKYLNDNLIITFSDIIYDYNILSKIIKDTKGDIVLGVDPSWKKRYKFRYDHTFEQADKVCYNQNRQIIGIGKKLSLNKTKAEFIGMIKLSKEGCKIFKNNLNFIPKKKKFIKCKFTNI